ncbi:hypothetical protein [Roseovarius sp. M141]|uniref:hypothetical protein n=1 Tax=Roseovarius sp. M141 TaxID=2583806 RepID=UPI0020CBA8D1|nr:hypothetical protein [Roseovarius sp. M141]MCQ0092923.1 hypothetical protein [Roseovarius sp. M141]
MKPADIIDRSGETHSDILDGEEPARDADAAGSQDHTPQDGGAVGAEEDYTSELGEGPEGLEIGPHPPPDGEPPDTDDGGPFGLMPVTQNDPFHFVYYFKPGRAPTDKQLVLALKIGGLMQQLSRFRENPTATKLAGQLRGIFQAGLVQASAAEPDIFDQHVTALETDFLNRVVTPAHRARISRPTFNTVYAFAASSILGFLLYYFFTSAAAPTNWSGYAALFSSLLFVVSGTLLGRLFFMVVTHQSLVTSINQFDTDGARIGSGGFVIFLDAIVGVIAFLVFYTGFLQIAIGADEVGSNSEQVRSALSTLDIKSKPSVAYLFGVIVGIARTQFIARVSSLARERLE